MNTNLQVFAIRHKPTGDYIPFIKGRGGSFLEPIPGGGKRRAKATREQVPDIDHRG